MASRDRVRLLAPITPAAGTDGVRATTEAENNKRTERYQLRVSAAVQLTAAGTAIRNRGSVLAFLGDIGYIDGGQDRIACDARLMRFIADRFAPSALPATRETTFAIHGPVTLTEVVPVLMSAYRTAHPNETKYVESNKQLQQQVFVVPSRVLTNLFTGGTGTITDLTAQVEQVYDDLLGLPPFLQTYIRQIVTNVVAANAALRIDLRGSRFLRGIAIQQVDDTGEIAGLIANLVLRGDNQAIIGDRAVPFVDLRDAQGYEDGGEIPPGYLFIDFCRYGRLSTMFNPYQDTNLRLELDVNPAGFTNPRVRVALLEYERTPSTTTPMPFAI